MGILQSTFFVEEYSCKKGFYHGSLVTWKYDEQKVPRRPSYQRVAASSVGRVSDAMHLSPRPGGLVGSADINDILRMRARLSVGVFGFFPRDESDLRCWKLTDESSTNRFGDDSRRRAGVLIQSAISRC